MALALGALAGSAVLLFLGTGLTPDWRLTWLAPLPVMLVAPRLGRWPAFAISAAAWFLGGLNMWHYLHDVVSVPVPVTIAFLFVPACVFGVAVMAQRSFSMRGMSGSACLGVPAMWTTYEYLTSVASPHGTFGNLAYTQMDCLPVLQLGSVTGLWGISFLLLLLPSTAAALFAGRGSGKEKRRIGIVVALIFVSVLTWGVWKLSEAPNAPHQITVALIASDASLFPSADDAVLKLTSRYCDAIHAFSGSVATRQSKVFVLPEKIAVASQEVMPQVDALFARSATTAQAMVIVGLDRETGPRRLNEARVYSPAGAVAATYHKHHLIPGFEDVDLPGTERTLLNEPSGTWGIEICKDLDFPLLSRQYARDGAGLLLVPAWDFDVDGWLHSRMAIMRGVESGFTVARTAKQGRLTVSDDRGRVHWESRSAQGFASLVADLPVAYTRTLYVRFGDWFAWLNLALFAVTILGREPIRLWPPR